MKKFLLALVVLLIVEQTGAFCPEKFAILFQGNEQFWKPQDELLRTLTMNNFRQENIIILSYKPLSLKRQVLAPSNENLASVAESLANTSCADEVLIDLAGEATAIWDAEIEFWNGSDTQTKQFFGKPYSFVLDKNYSECFEEKKVKHLKECAELAVHHRDIPDGYRVVGEPVITDWCIMMKNTCVRSRELKELLAKIPAHKTLIAAASYSGALKGLQNTDVYAASRDFEPAVQGFHKAFVQSLFRTKINVIDSFAQAKAFTIGTSGTMPQVIFSKNNCKCPLTGEQNTLSHAPKMSTPTLPNTSITSITSITPTETSQLTPSQTQTPLSTPAAQEPSSKFHIRITQPPAPIIGPAPQKMAIVVKKQAEPAVMRKLPESDCLAQCAKITVAAPKEAKPFSSEILEAKTPSECKQKASFATFLQKEPCTNYYLTIREISTRVGKGTEFKCCCRRMAKEEKTNCTKNTFSGWNELGIGVIKGEKETVMYTS
ncbi:MAG: hypothetical protein HY363_02370 [Candidatus Aenigmarchaeota archaeon]|nr:hypothetical protein [Candidatus Aenigmarchaeota archaeon]